MYGGQSLFLELNGVEFLELTKKQAAFCAEYLKDLNATQAAIRAGYSEKTAKEQASRLLINVNIKKIVQKNMDARSKRTEITADYILYGIRDTIERCCSAEEHNPSSALKGYELLGRHLKLFSDKTDNSVNITVEVLDGLGKNANT